MLVRREGARPLLSIVWLHEIARGVEDAAPYIPTCKGCRGEQCSPVQFGGHAKLRGRAMLAPQISTYPMRADDQHRPLQNEGRDIWPRKGANGEGSKSVKKNAALLHFLAFGSFDHNFGVLRGEQPLRRGCGVAQRSKPQWGFEPHERASSAGWRPSFWPPSALPRNSGTFSLPFWSQKGRLKGKMPL